MSKRKRNVACIKPEEPAFITRMKAEAGYKEGPTVDTKREALEFDDDDRDDHEDEAPQVVVLKDGDLTAEEATKLQVEKEEGPADLTQRVVFRKPEKLKKDVSESSDSCEVIPTASKKTKKDMVKEISKGSSKSKDPKQRSKANSLLSFNEDDEAEEF